VAVGALSGHELSAVTFPNLYTVAVMLDPAAPDSRAAATRAAMAQLLERITGRTDAGEHPDLLHMVQGAAPYVNSYGRVDRESATVGFIASDVDRALTAAGWPVWGAFDERVESASLRYGADAYLLAQVRSSAFGLDIRWTLVQGGRRRVRLSTGIEEGIDWVAEEYASDYSVVGGHRTLRLTVHNVQSLTDYGRVMSYLESVSLLTSVDVEGFDGAELNLRLAARGDETVLERVLALGGVLARATTPMAMPRSGVLGGDAMHFEVVRAGSRQ
jgi:hypothetical protein